MVNGESTPSQAAIGRALNLSPAAITKLKGQGMPVDSVASAQAWREARQNIAARKPVTASLASAPLRRPAPSVSLQPQGQQIYGDLPDDDDELDEVRQRARTRREISDANMAEMTEAEMRKDLIRILSVRSALAVMFATTRDALLQIPARLAPLLAADTDPASVQNALHAEIHRALADLAGAPARIGQAEESGE